MFLAINDIKYNKKYFSLITSIVTLIGMMVFFLTALALGLYFLMISGVNKFDATHMLLSDSSNKSVQLSVIPNNTVKEIASPHTAGLGISANLIEQGKTKKNVQIFAMQPDSFITPNITEGRMFKQDNEIVANDTLKKMGYKIGDKVKLASLDTKFKLVGFTDHATYIAAPVIYMNTITWQGTNLRYIDSVSAIATKHNYSQSELKKLHLESITVDEFKNRTAGVSEQNMTIGLMIGGLIVISALILGVFMYVLTIQKKDVFGVMKAQGISNMVISKAVVIQTLIFTLFGTILSEIVVILLQFVLPDAVPFTVSYPLFALITLILVIFSLIGSLFSVRTVIKIDPLTALKGR